MSLHSLSVLVLRLYDHFSVILVGLHLSPVICIFVRQTCWNTAANCLNPTPVAFSALLSCRYWKFLADASVLVQGQKPGDYVLFRVEIDCIAVMSACPHDLAPYINGEGGPRDVNYQVFEAK